jgi:hypothetical protein
MRIEPAPGHAIAKVRAVLRPHALSASRSIPRRTGQ